MTQKNIWNISVKELMEKYQVTEQGLTTARAEELRLEKGENILQESRRKVLSNIYIGCYTRNYFFDKIGSKRVWFSGIKFADYGKAGRLRDERNDQKKK